MRIGIDGYNLALPSGTGVAAYGLELANAIGQMGHDCLGVFGVPVPTDPALRETVFFDRLRRPRASTRRSRWGKWRRLARSFGSPNPLEVPLSALVEKRMLAGSLPIFDRIVSAADLFDDAVFRFRRTGRFTTLHLPNPPNVMHWTYPLPIVVDGVPNIYTLHDLVPLKLPYTTLDDKQLYDRIVAGCIDVAAQLCTVSESSKRDIVERYGINPGRVTNTYQTATLADEVAANAVPDDALVIERLFGLPPRGYFLFYGAIEPKKNVGRLIEAYLSLGTATPLVIVGPRGWQADDELRLMPGVGTSGDPGVFDGHRGQTIVRLDYLARPLLAKLVRGAKAVVFPSLYEGFGLPVLEAFQLGTPVITSTTSSLPEVAGDAALLIDPYDVAALAEALRRVDGNAGLAVEMAVRGRTWAMRFSREQYRHRLAELYRVATSVRTG